MPPDPSFRLLTRDQFRAGVHARDGHRCVACPAGVGAGRPGQAGVAGDGSPLDAHHLLNRRLFTEADEVGGYFLANGVSLCPAHHLAAEVGQLTVEELRTRAGILTPVLPRQLTPEDRYDTWGNGLLGGGRRVRGPLFHDEACQKALAAGGALADVSPYVKAPRIAHLPWSEGAAADDLIAATVVAFAGEEVIVTAKLDGENTTCYRDYLHARSLAPMSHPSQSRVKAWHAAVAHEIPEGWRVCVENCAAWHTVPYTRLASLWPVVSVWDEQNRCLPWDDTVAVAEMLGVPTVPVLYRGPWDDARVRACQPVPNDAPTDWQEGYVVRVARSYGYAEATRAVAKFVSARFRRELAARAGVHWASAPVVWNTAAVGEG